MNRQKAVASAPTTCDAPADHACALCGDEALLGRVVSVDVAGRTAEVSVGGTLTTVALDLIDNVAVGSAVLVHQGFVIGRLENE